MVALPYLERCRRRARRPAALNCPALELRENGDVRGLRALLALLGLELDLRALGERPVAAALDRAEVHEQVLTAVVRRDEPVTLVCVEPLDGSGCHICIHLPANFMNDKKAHPHHPTRSVPSRIVAVRSMKKP